jgi:release factor glutamine methyltransferase
LSIKQLFLQEKDLPRTDLMAIVSHVIGASKERILMDPNRALTSSEYADIKTLVEQRRKNKPLAYLTNRKEFFSETFYIDGRVLIPRPETEVLVEEAIHFIKRGEKPVRALDMGTGSGVIGITLARHGAEDIVCVDKSVDALAVAKKNAHAFGLEDRISFLCADLMGPFKEKCFDLVCANLPYIAEEDWKALMSDVRDFEPRQALVGGPSGNELYEQLVHGLDVYLSKGSLLLCEIDGPDQANAVGKIVEQAGFKVGVKRDFSGRERVVSGLWTNS